MLDCSEKNMYISPINIRLLNMPISILLYPGKRANITIDKNSQDDFALVNAVLLPERKIATISIRLLRYNKCPRLNLLKKIPAPVGVRKNFLPQYNRFTDLRCGDGQVFLVCR